MQRPDRSPARRSLARSAAWLLSACLLAAGPIAPANAADNESLITVAGLCGSLENGYGPYDYRTATAGQRSIVERFHFTPQVETLQRGSTGEIGGDLDYTLRAFPNHPRALYAMGQYSLRLRSQQIPKAQFPAECYFDRAVRFAPNDAQVRALYADFLIRLKRPKEARQQLDAAARLKISPQVAYNLSLAWANLGDNTKALPLAKRAYAGGIQFPGLRDKLKAAGVWHD